MKKMIIITALAVLATSLIAGIADHSFATAKATFYVLGLLGLMNISGYGAAKATHAARAASLKQNEAQQEDDL